MGQNLQLKHLGILYHCKDGYYHCVQVKKRVNERNEIGYLPSVRACQTYTELPDLTQ